MSGVPIDSCSRTAYDQQSTLLTCSRGTRTVASPFARMWHVVKYKLKEIVMIIELGKVSVETKAVASGNVILDPTPLPPGKQFQLGSRAF